MIITTPFKNPFKQESVETTGVVTVIKNGKTYKKIKNGNK
jgi:hypothetical protein